MTRQTSRTIVAALATTLALAAPSVAGADPVKCQRGLAKASAKYVQGRTKALDRCERGKTTGQLTPGTLCASEPVATAKFTLLAIKLSSSIAKSCGGADKICGNADDDSLTSIG